MDENGKNFVFSVCHAGEDVLLEWVGIESFQILSYVLSYLPKLIRYLIVSISVI